MDFSFTNVKVDTGFEPMPSGWYSACITELKFKPTKAANGEYLSATFTIIGDEYRGRKVFHMYNLENPNPKAVEIAMTQMFSLLIETGSNASDLNSVSKEQLVQMLLNKNVGIKLKIEISDQYGDKNVVVGYKTTTNVGMAVSQPSITTDDLPF